MGCIIPMELNERTEIEYKLHQIKRRKRINAEYFLNPLLNEIEIY